MVTSHLPHWCNGMLMRNVTDEVFSGVSGAQSDLGDLLPVAFGDFNFDKFTDVFTVNRKRNSIRILLAKADELTSTHPSENTNGFQMVAKHLQCQVNMKIQSVIPGDFDGDGAMDVLLVVKDEEEESQDMYAFVLWGQYSSKSKRYELICHDQPRKSQKWHVDKDNIDKENVADGMLIMRSQPILVMANGDYTADLFGSRPLNGSVSEEERGIWIFKPGQRETLPEFVPMYNKTGGTAHPAIKRTFHSNAFIDVNQDGNADLLVVNENNILEIWENVGDLGNDGMQFQHQRDVNIPNGNESNFEMGQAAFADFDMDRQMDIIIPITIKERNLFLFSPLIDLFNNKEFQHIEFNAGNDWAFDMPNTQDLDIYSPLTPRVGDMNLDGFPDILIRMRNKLLPKPERKTQFFLNIPWPETDDPDVKSKRGFLMQSEVMEGINSTTMATFFDLYEDGINDIISVQKFDTPGVDNDVYRVGAFRNATKSNDAYFVKVIILTGACYRDSCSRDVFGNMKNKVPFGTNVNGQEICYRTEMLLGEKVETIKTCASQLPQTSHSVMQLPYTIFGLGSSPNFLDSMSVNVTNSTAHGTNHKWTQIIPNSQIYIVPYPPLEDSKWEIMLFITPSHAILVTALALLGVCILTVIIIAILHWRERKQDLKEKLQDAQRFHFDAM